MEKENAKNRAEHYDVGIFGVWSGCNYGSIATYYALNRILTSMGKTVLMIDKPILMEDDVEVQENHSRRFGREHYNISRRYRLNEMYQLNNICDAFLIGSDQVWNYGISKNFGKAFYLDFAGEDKKKIAYAISFGHGIDFAPPDEREVIADYMRYFDGIGTREEDGVKICRDCYGIKAEQVIDPVFLADPRIYDDLAEKSSHREEEPFIVSYILDPSPEKTEAILHLRKQFGGIKAVNLLDGLPWLFEKNKKLTNLPDCIENLQVEDWLYYLKNARFVLTDSCHGASFALIFKRNFIAITNRGRGVSRFNSLSRLFRFENHMTSDPKDVITNHRLLDPIDYGLIADIMDAQRRRCYQWLYDAVNLPKKNDQELIEKNQIGKVNPINKRAMEKPAGCTDAENTVLKTVGEGNCSGCGACEAICPKGAIKLQNNEEGFLVPVINRNKCINCGICLKKCTSRHPDYKNDADPKCYAMMADDETRAVSSSGGMFSVAAERILECGGVVCGAAYREDYSVEHIIIEDKKELGRLRGSKYMQSYAGGIFPDIKQYLQEGRTVLFTGMPCQVAGLYSYLGKDYDSLYTIDLLCHGITSSKVFEKYHRDILGGKELSRLEFKEKEPWGWHAGVNAYFTDGTKYSKPLETDPYFIAYLKSIAKNRVCGNCVSNRLPRQGDLTIGDFWGIAKYDEELYDKRGTSVVLVNNQKAETFFDTLKPAMKRVKEEPLDVAVKGNRIIQAPYRLHKNRNQFFRYFDELDFSSLTMGCHRNELYKYRKKELLKLLPEHLHEYYYLARTVAEKARGRKIVLWMRSKEFEKVLKDCFGMDIAFSVARNASFVNGKTVYHISEIRRRSGEFYIAALDPKDHGETYKLLNAYGYSEIEDFICRYPRPIVLEKYDCASGAYTDAYGNTIEGYGGRLGKVVFRGGNNHIIIGDKAAGTENLTFDLSANASIEIREGNKFTAENRFIIRGYNGRTEILIQKGCRFTDALFRLYNSKHTSSVLIHENCTFESDLELHANSGKKIVIGRDCMFSHDVDLWAGDGHSVFDTATGENVNSIYDKQPPHKNEIVIGEHVWVSKGAFIMHGTAVGTGSIIGAKSVVKGQFPNNCTIGGNPAKLLRTNTAWSREMVTEDIGTCGREEYYALTEGGDLPDTLPERKVLEEVDALPERRALEERNDKYIEYCRSMTDGKEKTWMLSGGSTGLGKALAIRLYRLGYRVVATSRELSKLSELPEGILKIQLDVRDINSCRRAVKEVEEKAGKIDVLVNNAGLSHISTFEETPDEVGEDIMETNYWGVSNMLKAIIPHMRANGEGTVINISSASGFRPRNYGSYYVASKFAVENLTKYLKFECRKFMRLMAVEFGGLNTGLNKRQTVIQTRIEEYKRLPPIYPFPKGYRNNLDKAVDAVIRVADQRELPRGLVLGWDACQQFTQAMDVFENETEKYKSVSVTADEAKKDTIKLEDIILPGNKELRIRNWLITGASEGFGKILALRLRKEGYTVAVTSRDISKLAPLPEDMVKIESRLDSAQECERVIRTAVERMGSLDVLVNNATSNCWCSFEECPDDIMRKVFYVNYTLPQHLIKAALPYMRENKNGTVVNITSIAGIQPRARVSTYSAAKAALEGLTRVLKSECRRFARFMAVELVCMRTNIMRHNPVIETRLPEYRDLGRYTQEINNIPNRKDIAAQQIINVVNQQEIPQSLLIGTESYLIAKNEIERARKEFEEYKEITLSVCEKE